MHNNWSVSGRAQTSKSPNSCDFTGNGECATTRNRSSLGFLRFWPTFRADASSGHVPVADESRDTRANTPFLVSTCLCGIEVVKAASGEDSALMSETQRSAAGSPRSQSQRASGLSDSGLSPWGLYGQTH